MIDDKIAEIYSKEILKISPNSIIYPLCGCEEAKSLKEFEKLTNILLENKISKSDMLIAFGGGTIGDLTGYLASTYKRGVKYIQIPTTTLSMIDSSVGGKTAINVGGIKNAIGSIYPPQMVLIGFDVLKTLDKRNFNNGLFEALKMGLALDKNLFDCFKNEPLNIQKIVENSLKCKISIVEQDEFDTGVRKILNFGHTFGHAIELESGLLHGEAVANGMLIASKGYPYEKELFNFIKKLDCPLYKIRNTQALIEKIGNDKKADDIGIDFVVVEEVGTAKIKKLSLNSLKGLVENYVI